MTGDGGMLNFVNEDGSKGAGSAQEDIRKNQTFTMTTNVKKGKNTFKIYNYYRGAVKIKITVKSSKANIKFGKIYDPEKEIMNGNDMLGDSIGR